MNKEEIIEKVIFSFYEQATKDFLIGHHFRKIQEFEGSDPLAPPMEAFKNHLPKIEEFWKFQLIENYKSETRFNLIKTHEYLHIRKGEVGRWVVLFFQVLDTFDNDSKEFNEFIIEWKEKVKVFQRIFEKNFSSLG